ncbi:relaxase/mobilization nuclease domain-containing protein [Fournierella sp.]|uniref:relaxase/mobilization nuclease domain-containing protein n=1 Tax=Allofournierella sp. TaxID=1940256 RepID=UPI0025C4C07B|nr:relaxase/mobilization nuclease domain-containing protein [Fournierella sp.]
MAIISFTNYKRGQTAGCMGAVMRYTMQDKKTEFEGQQLITGINCQPESVYADFMTTKRLHHKTDGVLFYHMVQSFPKGEAVDPVTAHAAALKLAEYYEGYEVLVCTHTDREHIHSHFLINSVNFDTGKKLHIAKPQLQELRQRNDQVCVKFSIPVFQPRDRKQKTKTMTVGEYHTAARGQSKKLQLMNLINDCMRHASSREEFIALMESEGCKVRWEASRRNITYTTPGGWQCRDRLLFGDKYLKEKMEYEFRIRAEIIHGRTAGEEPSRADGTAHTATSGTGADAASRSASHESGVGGSAERPLRAGVPRGETDRLSQEGQRAAGAAPDTDADGRAAESGEASGADERTGWEAEREAFFSARHQTAQAAAAAPGWSRMGGPADGDGSVASAVVGLGYRLEQSQPDAPVMDSTTMHSHTDRKTLRKKQQKKIAQGHAEDDHEEEQTWQQTM